jgi:hypothetical protein
VLRDAISGLDFLVDSGAIRSVLPHQSTAAAAGPQLVGADGRNIPCWGSKTLSVTFCGCDFSVDFLLAAVSKPILGLDFFVHNNLVIDPTTFTVRHAKTFLPLG